MSERTSDKRSADLSPPLVRLAVWAVLLALACAAIVVIDGHVMQRGQEREASSQE